MHETR